MNRSTQTRLRPVSFEDLESRMMLAAGAGHTTTVLVTIQKYADMISIIGSSQRDSISVTRSGSNLVVRASRAIVSWSPTSTMPTYSDLVKTFGAAGVVKVKADLKAGNDSFTATSLIDQTVEVRGREGNDTLRGGGKRDSIWGGAGTDFLYGEGGNDYIDDNVGATFAYGGPGNDSLYVGDYSTGGGIADGGADDDTFFANSDDSLVIGGGGNDWIHSWGNRQTVYGGDGDDTVFLDYGSTVYGEAGNDSLIALGWPVYISCGDGDDSALGSFSSDTIEGGAGADSIDGSSGNDLIVGGAGNDTLEGGFGSDTLRGDAGDDTYFADDGVQDFIQAAIGGGSETIFQDMHDILG